MECRINKCPELTSACPRNLVISPGEYEFGTSQKEMMTVVSGALTVQLPGSKSWVRYDAGKAFEVAANTSFKVKTELDTAYFCTYE
ncbi:pyrimidine/purine nucleoside phosphorylase [Marinobacter sp. G11]|uniref:pyrimidine/purine nucleoside phosphorylase n=1 Tax=Marinobacter sp. G11 TaxID=2903522 RepID=UPI002FCD86C1